MASENSNKLELHFELQFSNNRNVKVLVRKWKQIYDTSPDEALWGLIQLFVDLTGLVDTKIIYTHKNFTVKNITAVVNTILAKSFINNNCILYSSKLRENADLFVKAIILAHRCSEYFYDPHIRTALVFLLHLMKKKGEIFYATASVLAMNLMFILIDIAQDHPGNGINVLIKKYAPRVFSDMAMLYEYHDCVNIMHPLFLNAFERYQQSFFPPNSVKNIFVRLLTIVDLKIVAETQRVIRNVLETELPTANKLFVLELFGTNEIMTVLLHDATGSKQNIALGAHTIINIVLNHSGTIRINHYDFTPLLLRMYHKNRAIRKIAGTTFRILNYRKNIIENMITFHLQYANYRNNNISDLLDVCCVFNEIDVHLDELFEILKDPEKPDAYKIVAGQLLLHLYIDSLCEQEAKLSKLLEIWPELFLASNHLPHVTLDLLKIIECETTECEADENYLIPIVHIVEELVLTHTDYHILSVAHKALNNLNIQRPNIFAQHSCYANIVQSIYNNYDVSRCAIHADSIAYKACLIRFCAAVEFLEYDFEILQTSFQNVLDTLFIDLTKRDVDDTIREHQIILYTVLVNKGYGNYGCVELVKLSTPFLESLLSILSASATEARPKTLLTKAVIPGICVYYILASLPDPNKPSNNNNRIQDVPSYVYSNIGNELAKLSTMLSEGESNLCVMKKLLEYWVNLHKVQRIPVIPEANKILILYGNVEQISDLLENLLMALYQTSYDHVALIASIGHSFFNLEKLGKAEARNYTNSLYKYWTRKTLKLEEGGILNLFISILVYVLEKIQMQLELVELKKKNRFILFNYLHNYIKWLNGKQNSPLIHIINRILQFNTLTKDEIKILNSIRTELGYGID